MKMNKIKHIAIIALDSKKTELIEWSYFNKSLLIPHQVLALGISANILEGTLNKKVATSETGRLSEYRELCNLISNEKIDAVIIFGEAEEILEGKDISLVLEAAIEHNVVVATNRATADFIIHSSLMGSEYKAYRKENLLNTNETAGISGSYPLAKAS
jgi:methylglyoxal synthase